MHEQEAIIFIKNAMEQSRNALAELMLSAPKVFKRRTGLLGEYYSNLENCKKEIQSCEIAIKALEEIQQYRAIGKPKEVKQKLEELERWHTYRLAINVKNPFAKMSTSICHNCDHKDEYIEELEVEVEEYRKIGTLEECLAAVEKKEVRNKAIDDFAELLKGKLVRKYANASETQQYVAMQATDWCNEIAEQLKGGGVDD